MKVGRRHCDIISQFMISPPILLRFRLCSTLAILIQKIDTIVLEYGFESEEMVKELQYIHDNATKGLNNVRHLEVWVSDVSPWELGIDVLHMDLVKLLGFFGGLESLELKIGGDGDVEGYYDQVLIDFKAVGKGYVEVFWDWEFCEGDEKDGIPYLHMEESNPAHVCNVQCENKHKC